LEKEVHTYLARAQTLEDEAACPVASSAVVMLRVDGVLWPARLMTAREYAEVFPEESEKGIKVGVAMFIYVPPTDGQRAKHLLKTVDEKILVRVTLKELYELAELSMLREANPSMPPTTTSDEILFKFDRLGKQFLAALACGLALALRASPTLRVPRDTPCKSSEERVPRFTAAELENPWEEDEGEEVIVVEPEMVGGEASKKYAMELLGLRAASSSSGSSSGRRMGKHQQRNQGPGRGPGGGSGAIAVQTQMNGKAKKKSPGSAGAAAGPPQALPAATEAAATSAAVAAKGGARGGGGEGEGGGGSAGMGGNGGGGVGGEGEAATASAAASAAAAAKEGRGEKGGSAGVGGGIGGGPSGGVGGEGEAAAPAAAAVAAAAARAAAAAAGATEKGGLVGGGREKGW